MVGGPPEDHLSNHVHQAAGMIAAQTGCKIPEAISLLVVRAAQMSQSLEDTALDVLDRVIDFADQDLAPARPAESFPPGNVHAADLPQRGTVFTAWPTGPHQIP